MTPISIDHVEPAGVLGGEVELEAAEDPACFRGFKRPVQGGSGMRREVVEHHADPVGVRVVLIHEVPHALRKIDAGALVGNLGVTPGAGSRRRT